jgi:hypothetical protein
MYAITRQIVSILKFTPFRNAWYFTKESDFHIVRLIRKSASRKQ